LEINIAGKPNPIDSINVTDSLQNEQKKG